MTGLHYPDHFYADAAVREVRMYGLNPKQTPTGAYDAREAAKPDPVTKPAHYQRAGIETIDYIRATLDGPGFEAYCIGNVLKYVSRYREKGGVEDLRKAQVYLGWAIEPVKPANPAAIREAKIAYDVACDGKDVCWVEHDGSLGSLSGPTGRVPKWHPGWINSPPNCDGLSARDIRAPHPMSAEAIRYHDERLAGGESHL